MRVKTIEVFNFDELNEAAKEKARAWYRDGFEYDWIGESIGSINYFCECFGVKLINYSIDTYYGFNYETNASADHFANLSKDTVENMKLSDGYCLGETMENRFKKEFKTGKGLEAFNAAIERGFEFWLNDLKGQEADEYIDENMIINQYEFDANGERA